LDKRTAAPAFIYGTAWKEAETRRLTRLALVNGFRAVDTANQRRHYHEAAVGEALKSAFDSGRLLREDVFLQTKFTHLAGRDHRLPYDRGADRVVQVHQSFASSLQHLGVCSVDSFLLHGPSYSMGLATADLEAWEAMGEILEAGGTARIGVSNFNVEQLDQLCHMGGSPPSVVQNRCFARSGWDRKVRSWCRAHGVMYQAFSLLTANRAELADSRVQEIAKRHDATVPQIVFHFAQQVGMVPLTGTSSEKHMREDLACEEFELSHGEMNLIERISG
jgi:diketogulonate reductase-like aldo/keto reductase